MVNYLNMCKYAVNRFCYMLNFFRFYSVDTEYISLKVIQECKKSPCLYTIILYCTLFEWFEFLKFINLAGTCRHLGWTQYKYSSLVTEKSAVSLNNTCIYSYI